MKRYYAFFAVLGLAAVAMLVIQVQLSSRTRHDDLVTSDLTAINNAIESYATDKLELPQQLSQLSFDCSEGQSSAPSRGLFGLTISDGSSKRCVKDHLKDYEYHADTGGKYRLCANFLTKQGTVEAKLGETSYIDFNRHNQGHVCFQGQNSDVAEKEAQAAAAKKLQEEAAQRFQLNQSTASNNTAGQVTVCGKSYAAYDPTATVTAADVNTGSSTLSYPATASAAAHTRTFTYGGFQQIPLVFDSKCGALSISDVSVGDKVSVYYLDSGKQIVSAIKLLN